HHPHHASHSSPVQHPFSGPSSSLFIYPKASTKARQLRRERYSIHPTMLILAAQMADKHEAAPTAMKPPKAYRETVKIGSASSWNKITLALFHVAFDRNTVSDLRDVVDPKYFQTPTVD